MGLKRRSFLGGVIGLVALSGCSEFESGEASLEWANERDEEVRVRTIVRSKGGFLSDPSVVYHDSKRVFPTEHYRAVDYNAFSAGNYRVEVTIEGVNEDEDRNSYTHNWNRTGCENQRLIIIVESDLNVAFEQRTCQ